jgi:glycosyltransferase involved in cell wall biosynthesis
MKNAEYVKNDLHGPLVTVALFIYNQEKYVQDAIESVLNQDYNNIEFIVSDDASTDRSFEIARSVIDSCPGSRSIILNRNEINMGLASHFSKVVSMARGEIVVVAAGDDISLPDRVSRSVGLMSSDKNISMVAFTDKVIDAHGGLIRARRRRTFRKVRKVTLRDLVNGWPVSVSGASRAYRSSIFKYFGDLNSKCPTEDTTCLLRGLILGDALVSSQPGIFYRKHDANLSGKSTRQQLSIDEIRIQQIEDVNCAIEKSILSSDDSEEVVDWIERNYLKRKFLNSYSSASLGAIRFLKTIFLSKEMRLLDKLLMALSIIR